MRSYNYFFHGVLPKVQTAVLGAGTVTGMYYMLFVEARR